MAKVTIFRGFSNVIEDIFLVDMLGRFQTGYYSTRIIQLRQLRLEGRLEEYNKLKRELEAFTPSGRFEGGRRMEYLVDYTYIMVLDFDKLPDDELERIREAIIGCSYTLACFVSPSGNGLKVLVRVSTGVEEHLKTFLALQQYFMELTGVKIDASGKDVTRLCFVSFDPRLYHNKESEVFSPVDERSRSVAIHGSDDEKPKSFSKKEIENIAKNYKRCIGLTERFHCFIDGHRNDFVYALALSMRKAGMTEEITSFLLLRDYNFDEKEVRSCIKSAFGGRLRGAGPVTERIPVTEQSRSDLSLTPSVVSTLLNDQNPIDLLSGLEEISLESLEDSEIQTGRSGQQLYLMEDVERLLSGWYETHYNEIKGIVEFRHAKTNEVFIQMSDYHLNSMFCKLHKHDQLIPIGTLVNLLASDYSPVFNVFKAYLRNLKKWDRTTDYIGQLAKTVTTTDDPWWEFCFRKWYVAMVISLVRDEIINHTVIVLVGGQGVGKSSWMKHLLPEAFSNYYGTAAMQTDSKDTAIQLTECALIVMDDLENLNKKDLGSFKELITRPAIHIRRPYGRVSENLPRRASFVASVNHMQILTDITGTRRYLCAKVIKVVFDHDVDIDGCMAQAMALYKENFQYWFDAEEIRQLNNHNAWFMALSVEEEMIRTCFQTVTRAEWKGRSVSPADANILLLNSVQIANKISERVKMSVGDMTLNKIGKVMGKLGYVRIKRRGIYFYMVRLLDNETIEMNKRIFSEEKEDEDYLNLEEDMRGQGAGED
jgi:hypothetical protein